MTKDNTEVKRTLKDQLNKVGQSKETFDRAKKAYNKLFAAQKIKADFESWDSIGCFFFQAKEYMSEKKINMNSGYLTEIKSAYFKELTPQDVSNAVWLHSHKPAIVEWIKKNKRSLSNPASIKQAIRKSLVESKADTSEYQKFSLKAPEPATEPKDKSSDDKGESKKNNVTLDDNLNHLNLILNQLQNVNSGQWNLEQFKKFEEITTKLSDFYVDLDEKLSKKKLVKVNDAVVKKVASNK